MGTNYFLKKNYCPHCHRGRTIHLGKTSCGWQFLFHKNRSVKDYKSFCKFIKTGKIVDEYGSVVTEEEMLQIVNKPKDFLHHDHCEIIDGYDFIDTDFS